MDQVGGFARSLRARPRRPRARFAIWLVNRLGSVAPSRFELVAIRCGASQADCCRNVLSRPTAHVHHCSLANPMSAVAHDICGATCSVQSVCHSDSADYPDSGAFMILSGEGTASELELPNVLLDAVIAKRGIREDCSVARVHQRCRAEDRHRWWRRSPVITSNLSEII